MVRMDSILKKLSDNRDKELYRRCDEILHYIWDPIGVRDTPYARDEYYGYLPQVFTLVKNDTDKVKIAKYLTGLEVGSMGLASDSSNNIMVAELLLEWKEVIWEKNN
jgi:hypothetical protein